MAGDATPIRVLHVDDDPDQASLTAEFLERERDEITVETVTEADAALARLADGSVDCIVSDYDMPGMNGLEFLEAVRADHPDLPFVLFTGKGSEEIASEAISAGVSDYLQKSVGTEQYELLANRVGNAVEQYRAKRTAERAERRLAELAGNTDDALWMYTGDWTEVLFVNDAYEDIWGQPTGRLREDPMAFLEAVHPDDRDRVRSATERLSAGEAVDIEFRVNAEEDYGRWAWVRAEPVARDGDDAARIVGFTRDVTARKERERVLEDLHDATRRLIECDSERAVARLVVETAREVLDVAFARCLRESDDGLVPVAASGTDPAALATRESGPAWTAFERGETLSRASLPDGTTGAADETERVLYVPVGDRGVLLVGVDRGGGVSDVEVSLAKVLASNAAAALERVSREEQLREEQAFTEAALDALEETFYVFDTEGNLLRWNDELAATTGYDDAELAEMDVQEFIAEEDRGRLVDVVEDLYESGQERIEGAVRTRDGDSVPMELSGAVLTDGEGETVGFVGIGRDISRRKERERELERYRRVVETMGDGVYALDEDGTYVHVNEYLTELSGYDREEWATVDPADLFGDDDIASFEDAIRRLLSEPERAVETVEADLQTADGETVPIEVTLTLRPMDGGAFRGTVGVVRDITERKERERELEEYETIVETIPDEVYALDAEGRFRTIIPPTDEDVTTSGYAPADLVGEHVSVIMDEDDIERGEEKIAELLADEDRTKASFEMEIVTEDGERIPNENHIALRPMDEGAFRGTVGVLRDITERKERERELRRQNDRLERLVGVVSHDLRNPLEVARTRLAFASEECDSDHIEHVDRSHERMETLIEELLTLARTGERPTAVEAVDLARVADACGQAVAAATTVRVETDRAVLADEERLRRLLENLFRNSVEHGGEGVTVTVGDCEGGFYVADDGPGIPPEDRDRVFESGYTTAEDGTGFGLSIVEEIATAHDWSVRVTDREGDDGADPDWSAGVRFEVTGVEFA